MRFRYLPVLFIAIFTALAFYVSGENRSDRFEANKETIVLRMIGHEVLLNARDSHSRVLPIQKISEHEFRISFENPVSLMPDSVVNIVNKVARENKLPEYVVNIIDCRKNETVYAFTQSPFKHDKEDIVPCLGRELPKDCYYLSLLFPSRQRNDLQILYYAGAALLVLAALFFAWKYRSKRKPAQDISTTEDDAVKPTVQLGKYIFHPGQQYLELDGERTTLTNKESRLLYIFATTPNVIIEREMLQKEVWGNEGVIVTRSLDMFISKLRKKLNGDTNIRIVNVHGKGYKLEIS